MPTATLSGRCSAQRAEQPAAKAQIHDETQTVNKQKKILAMAKLLKDINHKDTDICHKLFASRWGLDKHIFKRHDEVEIFSKYNRNIDDLLGT